MVCYQDIIAAIMNINADVNFKVHVEGGKYFKLLK